MKLFSITIYNIIIIFIMIGVGAIATKFKIIRDGSSKAISNILLNIVTPCMIINNLAVESSSDKLEGMGMSFLIALLTYSFGAIIVPFIHRKNDKSDYKVSRYMSMYANCGYMGLPLVNGILGSEAAFYVVAHIAVFNLFVFTHGIIIIKKGEDKISIKSMISPALVSICIGIILFFCQIPIPNIIKYPISSFATLNTPIAMLVAGYSIYTTNFKEIKNYIGDIIKVILTKQILIPLFVIIITIMLPLSDTVRTVGILIGSCSSATNGVIFAYKYDRDASKAAVMFAVSTISLILTLPIVMGISSVF